jgi:HEAT repeat protein
VSDLTPVPQQPDIWVCRARDRWFSEVPLVGRVIHAEFAELESILASGSKEDRMVAALMLHSHGDPALDPLIRALGDDELDVRIAAASALGAIGDERAIPALIEALRSCFKGKSARAYRSYGIGLMVGVVLLYIALLVGLGPAAIGGSAGGIAVVTVNVYNARRARGKLVRATTEALCEIAERSPRPELRSVIDDLRTVSGDRLQQDRETRATSALAAERLEELTERIKALPLAAATPGPDAALLPHPATAPEPDAAVLPRASG